jgi:hypothetical protein
MSQYKEFFEQMCLCSDRLADAWAEEYYALLKLEKDGVITRDQMHDARAYGREHVATGKKLADL